MESISLKNISLVYYKTFMPFRFAYGHARASHRGVESILVQATTDDGRLVGWGEAVPRTYVTGETTDSVIYNLQRLVDTLPRSISMSTLEQWTNGLWDDLPTLFPSCAICALEGALIDLLAARIDKPTYELLGAETPGTLKYTASIGMGSLGKLVPTLMFYRCFGLKSLKIKVGKHEDIDRIKMVYRIMGKEINLYADANMAWDKETAIREIEKLHQMGVWAIEEPLKPKSTSPALYGQYPRENMLDDAHYENYRWIKDRSPIPLIADESLISPASVKKIINRKAFDILNIRLSKCGGQFIAKRMVKEASRQNLQFGIGAMVGESPILAMAGAHFATANPGYLYLQGFSHGLLHKMKFMKPSPSLRPGGKFHLMKYAQQRLDICSSILKKITLQEGGLKT